MRHLLLAPALLGACVCSESALAGGRAVCPERRGGASIGERALPAGALVASSASAGGGQVAALWGRFPVDAKVSERNKASLARLRRQRPGLKALEDPPPR